MIPEDAYCFRDRVALGLGRSYLISFFSKTIVVVFKPCVYDDMVMFLKESCESSAGCCYYFTGYSVALWQDIEDVIGFRDEVVCVMEIFLNGDKINREFYWRAKII